MLGFPRSLRARLHAGMVIPAHPLALNRHRKLDERRQRALTRYYVEAGSGGIAVGVHTTQFGIRDPKVGLLAPVLELAATTAAGEGPKGQALIRIAGVCGATSQALREARLARDFGYHAGLLSLGALPNAPIRALVDHARRVAEIIPLVGFYLQPAVGGRILDRNFWRRFLVIEQVVAVKIAPFNRYQTLDVVHALVDVGRVADVALYTGNDDSIVHDLITPYRVSPNADPRSRKTVRIVGGLLGHWAMWTRSAVAQLARVHDAVRARQVPGSLLELANQITDANAAIFDPAHAFTGCIPGIHEILRRQGLLAGRWCLDPAEQLSPGQLREIDRVWLAYPHLRDDAFVAEHLDRWLR